MANSKEETQQFLNNFDISCFEETDPSLGKPINS